MNNQKNRFWTFCFSLVPGAGEMYLGLYRQGISLMLCFFALLLVPIAVNLSVFSVLASSCGFIPSCMSITCATCRWRSSSWWRISASGRV